MATASGTTTESLSRQLLTINKLPFFGEEFNAKDKDGYTPLMNYVKKGAVDSVRILKEWGADITAACAKDGHTALMMAVNSMFDDDLGARMVDALLEGDVDSSYVNYADPLNGVSALMIALDAGKYAVSLKLMAAGADVNQLNASGYSALTYAVLVEDLSTIDFLLEQNSMLAINQMWDAVSLAFEEKNFSLCSRLRDEIKKFPQKFIDIGVASVIPEAVHRDIGIRSFFSPAQNDNMVLLVANNPGPDLVSSISSASMASRQSIQDGAGGVAPSAKNVRKQPPAQTEDIEIDDDNRRQKIDFSKRGKRNKYTGRFMKIRLASHQDGAASMGPAAAMTMPVANNPGSNPPNSAPSASMAPGQSIQDGVGGVAPSARNVRKQRPNAAVDDDVLQASGPQNNDIAPTEERQKRQKR